MSAGAPPLRFLIAAVGGWMAVRALFLLPDWQRDEPKGTPPPRIASLAGSVLEPGVEPNRASSFVPSLRVVRTDRPSLFASLPSSPRLAEDMDTIAALLPSAPAATLPGPATRAQPIRSPASIPLGFTPIAQNTFGAPRGPGRWSASAWLLVREEADRDALAPGGSLGGSQAGLRVLYRVAGDDRRPLALSGRLYAPLEDLSGAEAAIGLDWKPLGPIPLRILAERRQNLGSKGRSDFALTVYGGVADRLLAGGVRLDAYAQAGLVGVSDRDAFADGAVRLGAPVGPVEIGAGAWAAAQPGSSRIDAGPQLRWRLPTGAANLVLSAEYRFRIAGDAEPGSGPALAIAADF